ncbi:MAG: 30S ribosomal protein S16 [Polyangiales bacterium]
MVRIRLARAGAKKNPFYRIVVTDHRSPRGGRFLETIGTFDPLQKEIVVTIKNDRLAYWKGQGAQVSDTLVAVLKKNAKAAAAAPVGA